MHFHSGVPTRAILAAVSTAMSLSIASAVSADRTGRSSVHASHPRFPALVSHSAPALRSARSSSSRLRRVASGLTDARDTAATHAHAEALEVQGQQDALRRSHEWAQRNVPEVRQHEALARTAEDRWRDTNEVTPVIDHALGHVNEALRVVHVELAATREWRPGHVRLQPPGTHSEERIELANRQIARANASVATLARRLWDSMSEPLTTAPVEPTPGNIVARRTPRAEQAATVIANLEAAQRTLEARRADLLRMQSAVELARMRVEALKEKAERSTNAIVRQVYDELLSAVDNRAE